MINRLLVLAVIGGLIPYDLCADPSPVFFGVSDSRNQLGINNTGIYGFYQEKERGWFWYEPEPPDISEEEEVVENKLPPVAPKENPPPKVSTKPEPPKPLSSAWFRENLTRYRDEAVDNPTADNVSRYLYLQRVMLDKASRFSEVSQKTVMADNLLDENQVRPVSTFGANAMDERAEQGTMKAAKQLAAKAGIWFFYSSTCDFCIKEAGVLKGLSHAYGFKILPIALDGLPLPNSPFPDFTIDMGQAKKLGVETTPALFLAKPGKDGDVIPLGQGLLAVDEVIKRAVVLGYQHGWLTEGEYNETLKANPILIDPRLMGTLSQEGANNDDGVLFERIKESLRKSRRNNRPDG